MNVLTKQLISSILSASLTVFVSTSFASDYVYKFADYENYCQSVGGIVEEMQIEIGTHSGLVKGQSKLFCNFRLTDAFVAIGLETFASNEPSIAATYMKKLDKIDYNSPLVKGKFSNPSNNVCQNLGGSTLGFMANGGFANELGQTDICVFGDGSMVSGWSLIYMTMHRDGYDVIKNHVRAVPLNIRIPH